MHNPCIRYGRAMSIDDLWYKNAVIYCLDVEKYQDANGDGIGDFEGLMRRLDYLQGLGVTCVWLQPFYPSPNRDNGYDVADFYGVHDKHGSLGDFVAFMQHADALGIRVIIDLVVNHTSIDSPWFQQARADPHVVLSRLVCLVRRAAEESQGRHRLSGPADDDVDEGQARGASTTSTASTRISPT